MPHEGQPHGGGSFLDTIFASVGKKIRRGFEFQGESAISQAEASTALGKLLTGQSTGVTSPAARRRSPRASAIENVLKELRLGRQQAGEEFGVFDTAPIFRSDAIAELSRRQKEARAAAEDQDDIEADPETELAQQTRDLENERARKAGDGFLPIEGSSNKAYLIENGEFVRDEFGRREIFDVNKGAVTAQGTAQRESARDLAAQQGAIQSLAQLQEIRSRPGSRLRAAASNLAPGESTGLESGTPIIQFLLDAIGFEQQGGIRKGTGDIGKTPSFARLEDLTPAEREELDAIFEVAFGGTRLGEVARTAQKQQARSFRGAGDTSFGPG